MKYVSAQLFFPASLLMCGAEMNQSGPQHIQIRCKVEPVCPLAHLFVKFNTMIYGKNFATKPENLYIQLIISIFLFIIWVHLII